MSDEEGVVETPQEVQNPYSGMRADEILPDEFKGRDPAEVRLLLSQMPKIVKAQKEELDSLRLKMAGASEPTNIPMPQRTAEEVQQEFEELFDKNPREAIKKFVEQEYGGRFGSVEQRIGETEFRLVSQSVPDFREYEEDVRSLLRQSGAPATQQNIMGAYTMAVGNRELQRRMIRQRMSANAPKADPTPKPEEQKPELSPLQEEVARSMGLSAEEYVKYAKDDSFSLKIRT